MPELLRLKTNHFEFIVWANDISQRAKVYQNTLEKRLFLLDKEKANAEFDHLDNITNTEIEPKCNKEQPGYVLHFDPKIKLFKCVELNNISVYNLVEADIVNNENFKNSSLHKNQNEYAKLTLETPLFFENTQYHFEWIFSSNVLNAKLNHRSQIINDAFRFVPELKTSRGIVPARLSGIINTGNDVGWLRLPLTFELDNEIYTQNISFEVLPTKMVLNRDLPVMYRDIDKIYPLWRFSFVRKTQQNVEMSNQRSYFPILWLANFSTLRVRFESSLKIIIAAPHRRLQTKVTFLKAKNLKGQLPYKLAEKVKIDHKNGKYDKRYLVEIKKLSIDTEENRFVKMAVISAKRKLAEFEKIVRESNKAPEKQKFSEAFLDELNNWQLPLHKILNQSFLKEVGNHSYLSNESLVLQQKTGYSSVYRIWQELKFYLNLFGKQASISMKSIDEIYEIWCFLCIKQIIELELGFELVESTKTKLIQNDYFEYRIKDGFTGAFEFKRSDGIIARLVHEPKFTKVTAVRSYSVIQEPDIVLEVILPENESSKLSSKEEKRFIWIFDAKYRIKTDSTSLDNINNIDLVPEDAINQMHRYRDALFHIHDAAYTGRCEKKYRPIFGAFALYPGFIDQSSEKNPYSDWIEQIGIGAFALLPSETPTNNSGHKWLSEFLQRQIGFSIKNKLENKKTMVPSTSTLVERIYTQESVRIPYYGMKQSLYSELTLIVAIDDDSYNTYFKLFKQNKLQRYHIPEKLFKREFNTHVIDEIRFLGLAFESKSDARTKQIDKVWPVRSLSLLSNSAIIDEHSGEKSNCTDLYYLFELGKPLMLATPIINVPQNTKVQSLKFTTLNSLLDVTDFRYIKTVYDEVILPL